MHVRQKHVSLSQEIDVLSINISEILHVLVRDISQVHRGHLLVSELSHTTSLRIAPSILPDIGKPKHYAQDQCSSKADDHRQEATGIAGCFVLEEELRPNDVSHAVSDEDL